VDPSPAGYLIESGLVLVVIVAFAAVVVYAARRAGLTRAVGSMELLARLPLEARRSVYVVRVLDCVLIIGCSEAGLTKLGELPRDAAEALRVVPRNDGFATVLARMLRQRAAQPDAEPAVEQRQGHSGSES
jgi:flagellar biogenesis protein FliO